MKREYITLVGKQRFVDNPAQITFPGEELIHSGEQYFIRFCFLKTSKLHNTELRKYEYLQRHWGGCVTVRETITEMRGGVGGTEARNSLEHLTNFIPTE